MQATMQATSQAPMESREDVLTRLRYLQNVTTKSSPPHCHPISILILIISGGFVMVGMVMTTVSHWPGSVSVGYGLLRVPGPVIFGVSLLIFILGILMTYHLNRKERKNKQHQLVDFAKSSSKMDLNSSMRSNVKMRDTEMKEMKEIKEMKGMNMDEPDMTSVLLPPISDSPEDHSDQGKIPEPMRKHTGRKVLVGVETGLESDVFDGSVFDNYNTQQQQTITTTTTTVVKKKKKKKKKEGKNEGRNEGRDEEMKEEDEYGLDDKDTTRLKVKIKSKPGTSVNISHV